MLSEPSHEQIEIKKVFNVLRANVIRSRTTFTVIFLTIYKQIIFDKEDKQDVDMEISAFLQNEIRQTDLFFKLSNPSEWCLILQNGEKEASVFLRRLFLDVKNKKISLFEKYEVSFSASVAEIGNSDGTFEEMIENSRIALEDSLSKGPWQIEYITAFKKRQLEEIKISILEENDVFRQALCTTLENLTLEHFEVNIRTFQDGYEFLNSDWFTSSHTHLIIMNDILPRQNGLDVLHEIRKLPNNKRFIIYMMTKRKSEEDMIYAYESGVDNYLIKPFNLRLFEGQLKRAFERLLT